MTPNDKMLALAVELENAAGRVRARIPQEGPILGWRGFHIDLEHAGNLIERLELGARGVFTDDADRPTHATDKKGTSAP